MRDVLQNSLRFPFRNLDKRERSNQEHLENWAAGPKDYHSLIDRPSFPDPRNHESGTVIQVRGALYAHEKGRWERLRSQSGSEGGIAYAYGLVNFVWTFPLTAYSSTTEPVPLVVPTDVYANAVTVGATRNGGWVAAGLQMRFLLRDLYIGGNILIESDWLDVDGVDKAVWHDDLDGFLLSEEEVYYLELNGRATSTGGSDAAVGPERTHVRMGIAVSPRRK